MLLPHLICLVIIDIHFLSFMNQINLSYWCETICFFLEHNSLFPFHFLVFWPDTQFIVHFTIDSIFNLLEFRDISRSNFASKDLVARFNNSCRSDKLSATVNLWVLQSDVALKEQQAFATDMEALSGYGTLTPSVYLVAKYFKVRERR